MATELNRDQNSYLRRMKSAVTESVEQHVAVLIAALAAVVALVSFLLLALTMAYVATLHLHVAGLEDRIAITEIRERNNRAKLDAVLELYGLPTEETDP